MLFDTATIEYFGEGRMLRKTVFLTYTLILLLSCVGICFQFVNPVRGATTWTVDDDGPADFHTIQEAINAASDGDTIQVASGTYYEHVVVENKTLSLMGEDRGTTIIDGGGTGIVVYVTASNTVISSFTIQNSGYDFPNAGIRLDDCFNSSVSYNNVNNNGWDGIIVHSSTNCTVIGNNVSNNYLCGINIWDCTECLVSGNIASANGLESVFLIGAGIQLWESMNCTMIKNTVTNNVRYGIDIHDCANCTLRDNNMTDNQYNFGVEGNLIHDIDASNMVDGKPIYYWVNQHDRRVPADAGYVAVINSTNITVENLTLTNNHEGVILAYTNSSTIKNVRASFSYHGILARHSYNCTITGNDASHNRYAGIYLHYSENCTLSNNNVTYNNPYGIWAASYSTIIGNNVNNNDVGIMGGMYNNIIGNNVNNNNFGIRGGLYNNIVGNNVKHSRTGGIDVHSYSSVMENNVSSSKYFGIRLVSASISVIGNNINNCSYSGIDLSGCYNSAIIANTIYNNSYGIAFSEHELFASKNNVIYHNNFIHNANQTTMKVWNNAWDNGCEGNYWSDYNGTEFDKYGIGYDPYVIAENNTDYCPLMNPYMLGDVNHDAKVNILDISIIARAFGTQWGDDRWNPHADLDENRKINIIDISKAAREFGKEWKYM